MTGFTIKTFGGIAPKISDRLLPNEMATRAENVHFDSGQATPIYTNSAATITPVQSYTIDAQTKTLFKFNDSIWIGSDEDIDIVRSPLAEDPFERMYITGIGGSSGYPRMALAQSIGNSTYYRLGLPVPPSITTVAATPATNEADVENPVSRAYTYTLVTAYGEEGPTAVSPVSQIIDVYSDQTVDLTFPSIPGGAYNITKRRVYRTDESGIFRFVADVNASVTTFNDSVAEANLGEEVPSATWDAPPDDVSADHPSGPMQGLVALPNGILAGFAGKTVCFSEAFQPHAYPDEYKLTVKSDVVALAPMTNGILVMTKEKPAFIYGMQPESMSLSEIDSNHSCSSKQSVVDMGYFVMYASPDGLIAATETGISVATENIYSREQWQELNPSSIKGFFWEGHYIGFYDTGTVQAGFMFDPRGGKNAFSELNWHATAGYNDLEEDELYLVESGSVVKFQGDAGRRSFTWKSKVFHTARPINPGVFKVDAESYPVSGITFRLWADDQLKHTEAVTDAKLHRLPSGYKANSFQIQLSSNRSVNEVCVYESPEEVNG